jgi:hypothetical protein
MGARRHNRSSSMRLAGPETAAAQQPGPATAAQEAVLCFLFPEHTHATPAKFTVFHVPTREYRVPRLPGRGSMFNRPVMMAVLLGLCTVSVAVSVDDVRRWNNAHPVPGDQLCESNGYFDRSDPEACSRQTCCRWEVAPVGNAGRQQALEAEVPSADRRTLQQQAGSGGAPLTGRCISSVGSAPCSVAVDQALTPCQLSRARVSSGGELRLLGQFMAACDDDGGFSARQCHGSTGYCWCVNRAGAQIPGTEQPPWGDPVTEDGCQEHRRNDTAYSPPPPGVHESAAPVAVPTSASGGGQPPSRNGEGDPNTWERGRRWARTLDPYTRVLGWAGAVLALLSLAAISYGLVARCGRLRRRQLLLCQFADDVEGGGRSGANAQPPSGAHAIGITPPEQRLRRMSSGLSSSVAKQHPGGGLRGAVPTWSKHWIMSSSILPTHSPTPPQRWLHRQVTSHGGGGEKPSVRNPLNADSDTNDDDGGGDDGVGVGLSSSPPPPPPSSSSCARVSVVEVPERQLVAGLAGGGAGGHDELTALARVFSTAEGAAGGELRLSLGPPHAGGDVDKDVYRL